jgi:acetyl-CoA carboxylase carboxyltransferase component
MPESAAKGAQFIALANQQKIPLLFLQNITGFMVGRTYEEQGIIRNGAKLINAVSNSTVPAITIMIGGSYGAGNYAMCGRAYDPRFLFTWPNHRIAVMGPQQLAGVMDLVRRDAAARQKIEVDEADLGCAEEKRWRTRSLANPIRTSPPPACGTTALSIRAIPAP